MEADKKIYSVTDEGEKTEISLSKTELKEDRVICIIDIPRRNIWIWKGEKSSVRKKFIGARLGSLLRREYGFHFKLKTIDQGSETDDFEAIFDETLLERPGIIPPVEMPPPVEPEPITVKPPEEAPVIEEKVTEIFKKAVELAPSVSPPLEEEEEKIYELEEVLKSELKTEEIPAPPKPVEPPRPDVPLKPIEPPKPEVTPALDAKKVIKRIKAMELPPGFRRELVIIGTDIYGVAEIPMEFFGKKMIEEVLSRVDAPIEGPYFAEGYTPRVLVEEDGTILAVEFLKETETEEIVDGDTIYFEMKRSLGEFAKFFELLEEEK